jgi:PPM family protein phosphatase
LGSKNGTICEIALQDNADTQDLPPTILAGGAEGHETADDCNFQVLTYMSGGVLKGHKKNEDSAYMSQKHKLIAVADGVGGHGDGAAASEIVIDNLLKGAENGFPPTTIIQNAIRQLELKFLNHRGAKPSATFAMARQYQDSGKTFVECTNVGDAAVYLIHPQSGLIYASKDQSYVQMLLDNEILKDPVERYNNVNNNIISNAVGPGQLKTSPNVKSIAAPTGTYVFTFSDGITDFVTPEEIVEIVIQHGKNAPVVLKDLSESRQGKEHSLKLNGEMRKIDLIGADNIAISMMIVE